MVRINRYDTWNLFNCVSSVISNESFLETYKFCITKYWDEIKNDNRLRLKQYLQGSTPDKLSNDGISMTFAYCFARINNKFNNKEDILNEYFADLLPIDKNIYNEFLAKYKVTI
ncbi:hypothetical protein IJG72_01395 [bacterium]|nr:hypothetical protein [bacterium]